MATPEITTAGSGHGLLLITDQDGAVSRVPLISVCNIMDSSNDDVFRLEICHAHGVFSTYPDTLRKGHGCPKCSRYGFQKDKPAVLYYLSVKNGTAFKIGITNRTVAERYTNEELLDITLLKEWYFDVGQEAYDMEQSIIKQYKEFKYKGKKLLKSGNTELFFLDVLDLNKNKGN